MKILRNSLIISAYVLLMGIFFMGGYALGVNKIENDADFVYPEQVMNTEPREETEKYEVIAKEGMLCLYRTDTQSKTLIAGEKISVDVFPDEDMKELENGVFFDDLENAQAMFENFVS